MESAKGKSGFLFYALSAALALLFLAGYFLRHTLSAMLTSLVLAYLINPLLRRLEKKGIGRLRALFILYLLLALLLTLLAFLIIPYLGQQLDTLAKATPQYVQNLKRDMGEWQVRFSRYYSTDEGEWLLARGKESLDRMAQEISGLGYNRLTGLLYGLFNLVLAPVLVFFMLLYKQHCKDIIKRLTPLPQRQQLIAVGRRINRSLEGFLVGMFFDCMLVGLLTVFALHLLGIQFSVLNGLFTGFASIVPFIGVALAVIPPALIGYAQSGDIYIIAKVCAAYFIINVIIEGNLIKPLVMRQTLRLNPLAVIFAVMALGELMGFWGIVLAIPLAAVIKICAGEFKKERAGV